MKIITEEEYSKLTKEEQDQHHARVREELIKVGLIKEGQATPQKASQSR